MNQIRNLEDYADEVGGIYSYDEFEAIPFNHWKKDCEWIIFLTDLSISKVYFIPVRALTAREACEEAISIVNYNQEDDDDI